MSLAKLIETFSTFEKLPVDVEEVRKALLEYGAVEEIHFVAAEFKQVEGMFRRYELPPRAYGSTRDGVSIYYGSNLSPETIRFVKCKEMMHIYDVTQAHSLTQNQIQNLIQGLILPDIALLSPVADALKAEACAKLVAMHLLAPDGALAEMRSDYEARKLSLEEAAKKLALPIKYVSFILTDGYNEILTSCLNSIDGRHFKCA